MSIADQITRLSNAKAAIKQSIENKGVEVSDSALLDEYPALIDSIEVGSGGEGGADSFYETMWNATTNNNTDYSYLFRDYNGTSLDLSNLDTSNVTNMEYMFYQCRKLTSLDLSGFDTSNITDMGYMFQYCSSLTQLDVSNFNTSNVTDMYSMFSGCNKLTSLDLSNFDTSKVTNMNSMFNQCSKLTSLDCSNFNTNKVTNMNMMFYYCSSLETVDVSNFDTSNVTDMGYVFSNCSKLAALDVSNWDVSKVTSSSGIGSAFNNCAALVDFNAPKNIGANMDVSKSTALSHDSLMSIINNLATVTSSKTLTLGATNKAKLTADELAIATNKGWTLK